MGAARRPIVSELFLKEMEMDISNLNAASLNRMICLLTFPCLSIREVSSSLLLLEMGTDCHKWRHSRQKVETVPGKAPPQEGSSPEVGLP